MAGIKHLIQCHCILPQYKKLPDPVFHKFVTFSTIDEDGDVIPSVSRCNNCGVVHKIVDFCTSEFIYGLEDTFAITEIKDLRSNIPEKILQILDDNKCDIATWQQVDDILRNEEWGSWVILSKVALKGSTQIKQLTIDGIDKLKIESHLRKDEIVG
jgi:hypothetical protein